MGSEIVHFEIPAKNAAKLSKFYSSVFGWTFKDSGAPNMKYWMIRMSPKTKDGMLSAGGMYKRMRARDGPVNYINTSNIDSAIKKFKSAGGKIIQPKVEVMGMGWSARGRDPEGNEVGLFQPRPRTGRRGPGDEDTSDEREPVSGRSSKRRR